MPRPSSGPIALLWCAAAALAPADAATAEPRPLSAAERHAAELAALYLDRGPEAWWPRLAAASPLRALGRSAALDEIAARAGPPEGAWWRLETPGPAAGEDTAVIAIEYPSGIGEVLDLTLDEAGALLALRSLAEPRRAPEDRTGAEPAATRQEGAAAPRATLGSAALAGLLLVLALWLRPSVPPALPVRRRRALRPAGAALLVVAGTAAAVLACRGGVDEPVVEEPAAEPAATMVRLGALRPMREALALGTALPVPPLGLEGPAAKAERLWYAERLLWEMDLDGAAAILDDFPPAAEVPLVELLRGRLAWLRSDRLEAPAAYERALRLGPDHDGLRFELAEVLFLFGFSGEAGAALGELVEMGSRSAGVYYTAAALEVQAGRLERGEELLRTGWLLEPLERAELFGSPLLAYLATRSGLFDLIGLAEFEEPRVAPPERRRPIDWPAAARPALTGGLLRVAIGGGGLEVPGGWSLAPAGAPVEDVLTARRREVAELLDELSASARSSTGALAQPGLRRQYLRVGFALARDHRWAELEALTLGFGDDVARLPADLVQLRALALKRLDRDGEATRLMVGLARAQVSGQRPDPGSLYQLGELFAATGEHDVAMRLIRRAGELSPYPLGTLRLRQIALDKRLAESYRSHSSEHFELRFPASSGEQYAGEVAQVLEAEFDRLSRWIPLREVEPIEVSLFPLEDFVSAFSAGIDVAGLYDGRVRVPFAHLRSFHPYLVSILSHEVAHAMIDQRTGGRAPDWLQEGLAQHVEMGQSRINPIPDLAPRGRVLALPVVDAALDGFSDPELVELAYAQAAWAVHFVEARYGVAGIHRLLDAFAAGTGGSSEAVDRAFGMTLGEFDRAQREWCLREAPATRATEVRRYDQELESPLARSGARLRPAGEGGPPPAAPRRQPNEAMERWHRLYSGRMGALRRGLGPAIGAVRSGAPATLACAQAEDVAADLLADPAVFASPDPRPGAALETAVERFRRMAGACRAGDLGGARRELAAAERELQHAASLLHPYGLAP